MRLCKTLKKMNSSGDWEKAVTNEPTQENIIHSIYNITASFFRHLTNHIRSSNNDQPASNGSTSAPPCTPRPIIRFPDRRRGPILFQRSAWHNNMLPSELSENCLRLSRRQS